MKTDENHDLIIAYKLYKKGIINRSNLQFITHRYFAEKYSLIFNNYDDSLVSCSGLLPRLYHFVRKLFGLKI